MKIQNRFIFLGSLSCFLCLLVSCSLSEELDKINGITSIQGTVSFNANVLNETLYLKDLITTDNLDLKEGTNGDYSFGFENSSDYKIESIIFPKINVNTLTVTLPQEIIENSSLMVVGKYYDLPAIESKFDLETPKLGNSDFPEGFSIKVIKLKQGAKILLDLDSKFNLVSKIKVTIPKLKKDGVVYTKTFDNIPANEKSNLIIDDLNGYSLFVDDMGIKIESFVEKTSNDPISGSMTISSTIDISDNHEFVEGFFGQNVLHPEPIAVNISLPDGLKKISTSDMIIKEITITLSVSKNSLTLPFDLDLTGGEGIKLVKQETRNNIFQFKIENLNILNLTQLKLTPTVTLNKGLTSGDNKLTDISSLTFNAKVDVPMDFKAEDLAYEQEGNNSFYETGIKESDFEFKDGKIRLIGSISSEIPLGATIQVGYRDSNNGSDLLSLFDKPIEIKSGDNTFDVSVTKEKLDLIKTYPIQVVKLTLNGSGLINSAQKISFKIGLAANGTITTKI